MVIQITLNCFVQTYSTCGLADEIEEQGKEPVKKTVTSSCGSVSFFMHVFD